MAVALQATTTSEKTASLKPAQWWSLLTIPMLPSLSVIFLKFMSSSFATDHSPRLYEFLT
jgi:hypothetical protein